jgi:hypothetical protein
VLADGTVKREQRTTLLGTVEEFPTKRTAFAEFTESRKKQVIE